MVDSALVNEELFYLWKGAQVQWIGEKYYAILFSWKANDWNWSSFAFSVSDEFLISI